MTRRHGRRPDRVVSAATAGDIGHRCVPCPGADKGKAAPSTTGGAMGSSSGGSLSRYVEDNGVVEKGINGVFDLSDTWLALTDRRLAIFKGAWFTLAPKPKKHVLDMPADSFTVGWRPEKGVQDHYLLHFVFPDDQNLVVMAEPGDAVVFLGAPGNRAQRIRAP